MIGAMDIGASDEPIHLESKTTIIWQNLTVSLPSARNVSRWGAWMKLHRAIGETEALEPVKLLQGASGYAMAGDLIAIMGPSGAGKTTLLASIARRIETTDGLVMVNGHTVSKETMSIISGYMPQFDVLPSSLTVQEYLVFVRALKSRPISGESAIEQRNRSLDGLLREVSLFERKGTMISRLSGGEKKRLSLAVELVIEPKILFLDEPTTGLDAYSARRVVDCLRSVSSRGPIVFCTIHQPGTSLYSLFTSAIFVTEGNVAYSGRLEDAAAFFSGMGFRCPVGYDESEYYVKVLTVREEDADTDTGTDTEKTRERVQTICGEFARSRSLHHRKFLVVEQTVGMYEQRKPSRIVQFRWLIWRAWLQSRRRFFADWISWLSYLLSIAAIGTLYAGLIGSRTQAGVQNTRGALYMMSSEIVFTVAYSVIYQLPTDLPILIRESTLYDTFPYCVTTFLTLIPKVAVKAFLFTILLYAVSSLNRGVADFLIYCSITTTAAICGTAYGIMFSSWIDDIEITTNIMVPIDTTFLLTAGMFYNLRSESNYLAYLKYFSIFFYTNEALSIQYWSEVEKIECELNKDLPCLRDGMEVLIEYGFDPSNYFWDMIGLVILTICMLLLGCLGIRRRTASRAIF